MEDVVQKTELLVVDPSPYHGDSCGGADHREEEDRAVDGASRDLLVEKDGKVVDVKLVYKYNYTEQMMEYSTKYSFLPSIN